MMKRFLIPFLLTLATLSVSVANAAPKEYGSKIHNFEATGDPSSATDDVTLGYTIGSNWVNVSTDTVWDCTDNTDGAAVWEQVDGAGGGGVTTVATPSLDLSGTSTISGLVADRFQGTPTNVTTSATPDFTTNDPRCASTSMAARSISPPTNTNSCLS